MWLFAKVQNEVSGAPPSSCRASRPPCHCEQMRARAEKARLGFDRGDRGEQPGGAALVGEPCVQIGKEPCGPFHCQGRLVRQAGRRELAREVFGPMEIRGREIRGVARWISVAAVLSV